MGIIDHLGVFCRAAEHKSLANFYEKALKPLGIFKVLDEEKLTGFGKGSNGEPEFEIFVEEERDGELPKRTRLHYAFTADSRVAVRDFHKAGLEVGAKNNGEPGLRKDYSPTYYAAFLRDPVGNTIEAVCQREGEEGD